MGAKVASLDDLSGGVLSEGCVFVIGAHGIGKGIQEKCEKIPGLKILSAVCPVVARNLDEIRRFEFEGDPHCVLVYLGKSGHSEAEAARSRMSEGSHFISCADDARVLIESSALEGNGVELMVQTSFSDTEFDSVRTLLDEAVKDFRAFNSICPDCAARRKEAGRLAEECDAVVVVGDSISSNAKELAQKVECRGARAILVMNAQEMYEALESGRLQGCGSIGVISSASSSKEIFEEVVECLEAWNGEI